jgi:SAM-dependent methyltransferase
MGLDRPELGAGGYTRNDGAVEFFTRVRALLSPTSVILEFGAGRGAVAEDPVAVRRHLGDLRGPGRRVVGVDIDTAVKANPLLDEAHVIDGPELPFDDATFDSIVGVSAFEHVEDPTWVARELDRVLKPGGWVCAVTPNRHGYIALGSRLVPNRWHQAVVCRLQPGREARDVFPTAYRMNSGRDLRRLFPASRFEHFTYGFDADPVYLQRIPPLASIVGYLGPLVPERLAPLLMVFIRKRDRP